MTATHDIKVKYIYFFFHAAIRYKKAWFGLHENLTPLTLALIPSCKQSEIEEYLRSCGCQLNSEDDVKDTIFYYASSNGRLDLLKELVEVYGFSPGDYAT